MQKTSISSPVQSLHGVLRNPLIIALDVDSQEQAFRLADDLKDIAGGFKLGPRLLQRYGQSFSQAMAVRAPVFIDCKFFDIPSTMEAAVRASFDAGANLVTIHAISGKESMTRLAAVEKELNQKRPFKILCVTILTSWDQQSLPLNLKAISIAEHVQLLVKQAHESGLTGIVCSPEELSLLTETSSFLVTPGIRLPNQEKSDQKRTLGPAEALKAGANALVVGRPIIEAKNPREAAEQILADIAGLS